MALNFSELPDDILVSIAGVLPAPDVSRLSTVCKRTRSALADQSLWRLIYIKRFTLKGDDKQAVESDSYTYPWKERYIQRAEEVRVNRLSKLLDKTVKLRPNPLTRSTRQLIDELGLSFTVVANGKFSIPVNSVTGHELSISFTVAPKDEPSGTTRFRDKFPTTLSAITTLEIIMFAKQPPYRFRVPLVLLKNSRTAFQELFADTTVRLLTALNGTFMVLSWTSDNSIAQISVNLAHDRLIQYFIHKTPILNRIPSVEPLFDDVDSKFGLHDFYFRCAFRSSKRTLYSGSFQKLHGRAADPVQLRIVDRSDRLGPSISFDYCPDLPWQTDAFKGVCTNVTMLDFVLFDEFKTPMWFESIPLLLHPSETERFEQRTDNNVSLAGAAGDKSIGVVHLDILVDRKKKKTRVVGMRLDIALKFINSWFGTRY